MDLSARHLFYMRNIVLSTARDGDHKMRQMEAPQSALNPKTI